MNTTIVRYRVKPNRAEENIELVKAVYTELAELSPDGFSYATFVAEDGVSFTHFARSEGEPTPPKLPAFKRFQQDIGDRCEEGPAVSNPTEVGSFRI